MNEPMPICPQADGCQQSQLCPLSRVVAGSSVRIKQLATPPDVSHRLRELGLGEEQSIRLLSSHSNFICLVCNARLGISSHLAENILVELLPAQAPIAPSVSGSASDSASGQGPAPASAQAPRPSRR